MVTPWEIVSISAEIFRLGSSRLSWCCSSFAIPYLGGSKLVLRSVKRVVVVD